MDECEPLMIGRFFGGIATSLLFTAFESWLVVGRCRSTLSNPH